MGPMIGISLASGPYVDTRGHYGFTRLQVHIIFVDAYLLECV